MNISESLFSDKGGRGHIYTRRVKKKYTIKILLTNKVRFRIQSTREMGRNRKSASLVTQSVLFISIENSFVLALIRSLGKIQKKTARHAKKAGFYMAMA